MSQDIPPSYPFSSFFPFRPRVALVASSNFFDFDFNSGFKQRPSFV